jgi:hypothetical protein
MAGGGSLPAWGGALLYPFEMDTVVRLSGERLVATDYGAYNTASGIAISLVGGAVAPRRVPGPEAGAGSGSRRCQCRLTGSAA